MKPITAVLAVFLAAVPTLAQAVDRNFAGLELGTFSHRISLESSGDEYDTDSDGDYAGLSLGRVSSDWRALATVHVPNLEDDDTVIWLTASYDYLFNEGSVLQPYAGGHFGYYTFNDDDSDNSVNSITVGPEAGVQLRVDPFMAEVGAKYGFGVNSSDNVNGANLQVDYAQTVFIRISSLF
ncbi:hypothetical protein [Thiohalorhabdus methylotrophus]|uniref:Outer membrane protein beta-barrel domain-containing protein n=1 Tax=Thiohalorhabdus methylotrophus TaxID=3242694 RepID=A0ABV4TRB9_9GAMM